jgi:hypothetical protein
MMDFFMSDDAQCYKKTVRKLSQRLIGATQSLCHFGTMLCHCHTAVFGEMAGTQL